MVLEHTSEALTEYLGQNVPSLASYSVNGLLHLIPVPPLSRTSFSKGEISHFFQRGNWEKWKKNALSRGVKKQKCTSRGGSSLFQRGQLHRFFCIPEG